MRHDVGVELAVFSQLFVQAVPVKRGGFAGVPEEKEETPLVSLLHLDTLNTPARERSIVV